MAKMTKFCQKKCTANPQVMCIVKPRCIASHNTTANGLKASKNFKTLSEAYHSQSPLILGEFCIIYVSKQVCINST